MNEAQCLRLAESASGCHADTQEIAARCRCLVDKGLAYRGPFANLRGNPVYFGVKRTWAIFVETKGVR